MKKLLLIGIIIISLSACVRSTSTSSSDKNLTFTVNGVSFEMIFVEGGTFVMGNDYEDEEFETFEDIRQLHNVTLSDYYMGKYELTQKLWQAVMGTNIRQQGQSEAFVSGYYPLYGEGDNYPMYYIDYNDCKRFCTQLNKLVANQLPDGYKFCMPTEAQWEYAARGGNKSKGYKYSGSNNRSEVAWYCDSAREVGMKKENELGFYDMTGNVGEWCLDWWDNDYYSNSPSINSQGPDTCSFGCWRIVRGCGWCNDFGWYVSCRGVGAPYNFYQEVGFRLVLQKQ